MQEALPTEIQEKAVDSETVLMKETDFTQKSLEEIRSELSKRIQNGAVLHGSTRGDLIELQPHYSVDYTPYKQRELTAVFATDQPLPPLFRGAFGTHLLVWRQAAFFQIDSFDNLPEEGYIYVLNSDDFIEDFRDPSEYTSTRSVVPIECIKISTKELLSFARSSEDAARDFRQGALDAAEILPEAVRTQDCILVLMTITTMLERVGYLDYTFNPQDESSMQKRDILGRLEALLHLYSVVLQSEKIKDPTVRPFVQKAISKCKEVTYGVYETYDGMTIDLAFSVIEIVENL